MGKIKNTLKSVDLESCSNNQLSTFDCYNNSALKSVHIDKNITVSGCVRKVMYV